MNATIISAQALSSTQKAKLEKAIAKKAGSKLKFVYETDENVIGGIRVTFGSNEFDATLKNKLQLLKKELLGKI